MSRPVGVSSDMDEYIRSFDWGHTPLGPMESWSPALRMMVRFLLANRFPLLLWWGPQYLTIYNDAYRPLLGTKHPSALGQPGRECWSEFWPILKPIIDTPFQGGPSTWNDDLALEINRHGYLEEAHFTVAYSPVPDETVPSGIGGVLATVHEITSKVVGDRRIVALRDLAARSTDAKTAEEACLIAAETLARHDKDIPFALFYLIDPNRKTARLAATTGVEMGEPASPKTLALDPSDDPHAPWPLAEVMRTETTQTLEDLESRLANHVPRGPWVDPPHTALVVPIRSSKPHHLIGFLVLGISSRLHLDASYHDFSNLVTAQISAAMAHAKEYEGEKRRAEFLQLDEPLVTLGPPTSSGENRARVLVAEEDADTRQYLAGLLAAKYDVQTTRDAGAALIAAREHRPDLILTDVMGSRLDGIALLREVRADAKLKSVPVILLSTRAGETSRLEGVTEKVDDYLVKPFSPWQLMACVATHIDMSRARKKATDAIGESDDRYRGLLEQMVDGLFVADATGAYIDANRAGTEMLGYSLDELCKLTLRDVLAPEEHVRLADQLEQLTSKSYTQNEWRFRRKNGSTFDGELVGRRLADGTMVGIVRDITRRKQAEIALRESEERFRALVQATSDVVYRMSPNWTVMCYLVGQDFIADTNEPSTKWLEKYIHPDDQAHVMATIHEAIRTKSVFQLEHRVKRVDGTLGWTFSRAVPILDAKGEITEWFGMASDVTEAHRIRENVRRQAELLDLAHDNIFILDEERRITYWNKGAELCYGWTESEVLGRVPHSLLQTKFPEPLENILAALERTDHWQGELVHTRRNGQTLVVDSKWVMQRNENGSGFRILEINNDVTGRKRAETERQKFISLAEHSIEFIGMCDLNFKPFYVNQAGRRLVGLGSLQEACSVLVQDYFFPEDQAYIMNEFFPKVLREGRGEVEVRFRHFKTGAAIWMIYDVFQLQGQDGEPVGYATVSHDITERKLVEEDLRKADRRKDEFLATLAHELRNPLAPIRTGLELLKLAGDNAAMRDKVRGTLERQTEQLIRLVNDLLDVSRITQGKLELRKSRVPLADVVRSAVESAQPFIDQEKHWLTVNIPEAPIYLNADPHRLAQVISNLLNNAARYTPPGGKIWLNAQQDEGELVLKVRDDGIGIRPEMQKRIFDMFAQADYHQGRAKMGLGIGLTLVKSLVEMHNGTVEVQSEGPNRGSEFTVRLPVIEQRTTGRHAKSNNEMNASKRRRVLIVDDNEAIADTLSDVLTISGHDVRTANDGEDALRVAADFRPDVILMDLGMPKMNGYEAARAIRQQPWGKGIVLVALTGWGQAEDRQRTRDAGFDLHMVKPPDISELERLLATVESTGQGEGNSSPLIA